ncbi:hypothetical protein BaRGS_00018305 [Batillaria attramentaria]|uniref:Uncharacterized protein n=1 Tax=Batillaria attramentaria TaxID=370345 RepID=A0ABD0KTF4_9CAEN
MTSARVQQINKLAMNGAAMEIIRTTTCRSAWPPAGSGHKSSVTRRKVSTESARLASSQRDRGSVHHAYNYVEWQTGISEGNSPSPHASRAGPAQNNNLVCLRTA